jgi:hypothetical protein
MPRRTWQKWSALASQMIPFDDDNRMNDVRRERDERSAVANTSTDSSSMVLSDEVKMLIVTAIRSNILFKVRSSLSRTVSLLP